MDSGSTRIKYVNASNSDDKKPAGGGLQGKASKKGANTVAPAEKTLVPKKNPNTIAPADKTLVPKKPAVAPRAHHDAVDPELARRTYEECRKAFDELAVLHSDAKSEAAAATRRLERTEQDLRREREQGTRYASHIATQETELRRLKEGKKAVEDLNSRLNAKLASKAPDEKLVAAHKATAAERDKLRATVRSCAEILDHMDQALAICAEACASHAPEIAKDMRDTRGTIKAFRRSVQA